MILLTSPCYQEVPERFLNIHLDKCLRAVQPIVQEPSPIIGKKRKRKVQKVANPFLVEDGQSEEDDMALDALDFLDEVEVNSGEASEVSRRSRPKRSGIKKPIVEDEEVEMEMEDEEEVRMINTSPLPSSPLLWDEDQDNNLEKEAEKEPISNVEEKKKVEKIKAVVEDDEDMFASGSEVLEPESSGRVLEASGRDLLGDHIDSRMRETFGEEDPGLEVVEQNKSKRFHKRVSVTVLGRLSPSPRENTRASSRASSRSVSLASSRASGGEEEMWTTAQEVEVQEAKELREVEDVMGKEKEVKGRRKKVESKGSKKSSSDDVGGSEGLQGKGGRVTRSLSSVKLRGKQ